ncbi:MAG TPA: sulfotransferase family 2 domain-containing protein [Thiobacillaceae bacterium]|nr:sulfotransferase family 2 domain-containing protein [Thiobacillaceae bacterium]HNU62889.1 sulfotransferase family 2 domain-containing protein [Thiobacillaceae bacterium]
MEAPPVKLHIRLGRLVFGRRYRHLKKLRTCEIRGYSLKPFDEHRCIFVHIPKAAGVSVSKKLFGCLGGGHAPIDDFAHVFSPAEFADYFKFTFVRNPWDRLLSAYMFLSNGGFNGDDEEWARDNLASYGNFTDFVRGWVNTKNIWTKQHFYPQSYFLKTEGRLAVDFVGRFENINEDFARIARHLGVDAHLEHLNSSGRKDYHDYYDEECREIVGRVYREDIELFDYRF